MGNRAIAVALLALAALFSPSEARAQCSGQPSGNTVCAAPNGAAGLPSFRALVTGDLPGATVSSVFARTGAVVAASGDYSFSLLSGLLAFGQMPNAAANTLYANLILNTPAAIGVPSCSGASNALTWTTGTGFGCNTITTGVATAITTGSTSIIGGVAGRVLFNNGTLGEYTISGTGNVAMTNSPAFTTPSLGVATATSVNGITSTGAGAVAYGTGGTVVYKIANGTAALGTSVIASAACASATTVAASGVLATDVIQTSFNSDPTGVTGYVPLTAGMLTVIPYPTTNNVNFKVCNNTGASITPGAITLNWRVDR